MLRLSVHCSPILSATQVTQVKLGSGYGSWIINSNRARKSAAWGISVKALKDETNGGTSSFSGSSWDPGLEIEVPFEQRPVNEYSSLKDGVLYSWGELGPGPFFLRLGDIFHLLKSHSPCLLQFYLLKTLQEPLRFVLAAGTGTLFIVSLIVLRIYLGWSYVGDRLLSAVIPYEESGWYDGQMWVKPPEVLARDRLLGAYKVKPVIKLLKQTLIGTGALLVTAVSLFIFATPVEHFFQTPFATKENTSDISASKINKKFDIRKEDLLQLPMEVKSDDDLAAAAADAADGRPVYCRDRFYRVLAGGQYCKWEDLLK
ncbi:hypothetical protein EZV62_013890 [Acer yangbiense]|uniref:Uncharacterized protein n=1 Tax=Acer yangbiense TaxID=1000413 RepID=A0A5C7HQH7_9ROSI|nr:hypothetical protein EZV62_013890 [Acer yangbiense]